MARAPVLMPNNKNTDVFTSASIDQLRIPLIADTHSRLITDSVPGDRGRPGWGT